MSPTTEHVQRLMEIGLIAAGNGFDADAEIILEGLKAVRPESELPLVGQAFASINRGRLGDAIALLQDALKKNPDSELALSFLGSALKLSGQNNAAEKAFQQVTDSGQDPKAVAFAAGLMQNPDESCVPDVRPTRT